MFFLSSEDFMLATGKETKSMFLLPDSQGKCLKCEKSRNKNMIALWFLLLLLLHAPYLMLSMLLAALSVYSHNLLTSAKTEHAKRRCCNERVHSGLSSHCGRNNNLIRTFVESSRLLVCWHPNNYIAAQFWWFSTQSKFIYSVNFQ